MLKLNTVLSQNSGLLHFRRASQKMLEMLTHAAATISQDLPVDLPSAQQHHHTPCPNVQWTQHCPKSVLGSLCRDMVRGRHSHASAAAAGISFEQDRLQAKQLLSTQVATSAGHSDCELGMKRHMGFRCRCSFCESNQICRTVHTAAT